MSGNSFKTLEKRIFSQLINLEEFYAHNNQFKSVEKDLFSNMKNIKYIDLSLNDFLQLDSETSNLIKKIGKQLAILFFIIYFNFIK